MSKYDNELKIDFPIFPNDRRATDRHPIKTGKIEFTQPFLKQMLEQAKTGTMPTLRVAIWDRISAAGNAFESVRLTMQLAAVEEPKENEDDDFPFSL